MWRSMLLMSLFALLSCNSRGAVPPAPAEPDLELQTYNVPHGMQAQIVDLLNRHFRALVEENRFLARAEVLPNGQLLVFAPKKIHSGVVRLMSDLEKNNAPPLKNSRLVLWMVLASRTSDMQMDSELESVATSLAAATAGLPHKFQLLERISLTASVGTRSEARGMLFEMSYSLSQSGEQNTVHLDVQAIRSPHNRLETRLFFKDGQDVVLGQSQYLVPDDDHGIPGVSPGTYTLFYILRTQTL